ncbi:MAG: hypothetical protein Ct9H90mP3_2430 [Flammeovirgaceae bacterium]|nr:MAG: hypothetical protein Ct9H90mP3_2430 [Flammeovirgaceae bacterium]
MFKSKYTIVAILIIMIFSISNIFSIVYIEYNAVSLVEYRKYSVECGPLLEILSNNIDFSTDPLLSMNRTSCRNMAIVTLINTFISIIFLTFLLVLVVRLIKNKTETEDLSDLINILKKRNSK